MNSRFEWDHEERETDPGPAVRNAGMARFWKLVGTALAILTLATIIFLLLSSRSESAALTAIQDVLDLAREACRLGDAEVFFSIQDDDPSWEAKFLQPAHYAPHCSGLKVVDLQPAGANYAATLASATGDDEIRYLAFFRVVPGQATQIPPPAEFWGEEQARGYPGWGTLGFREADEAFAGEIGEYVDRLVDELCREEACRSLALPMNLIIRPDFRETARAQTLFIASPRLVGLGRDGRPAPHFWDALDAQLRAYLTPGSIRFAVPPLPDQVIIFENAAAEFMARNPDIKVEIVTLDARPEEAGESLAQYDGAAYTPTAAMIAAGQVHDLTDYVQDDPVFDLAGLTSLHQTAAQWRDRTWFVPHAAQIRLLFFDRNAYEAAGSSGPGPEWSWATLERHALMLRSIPAAASDGWSGEYVLLDTTRDLLYAYALDHAGCPAAGGSCDPLQQSSALAAAFDWYRRMVEAGSMPDVAASEPADRARLMANLQGVPRRAAIWVDNPVSYEGYLQLWPVGVVPFPAGEGGVPAWVHGSFINSSSPRPLDVWRWLVFLSHYPVNRTLRYIPARSAMAEAMGYWDTLPPAMRAAMQSNFTEAYPVPVDARDLFSREQLDSVMKNSPPELVARPGVELRWFGR